MYETQKTMPLAQEQVSAYLRNRHHQVRLFSDNDDFRTRNQTDLLQTQQSVTGTKTMLLSSVAVVALVVGGIGIMNIMLVSVTERTREIGLNRQDVAAHSNSIVASIGFAEHAAWANAQSAQDGNSSVIENVN